MRNKFFNLPALVLLSSISMGALSYGVMAQDQVASLQPKSGWSVSPITSGGDAAGSYCALSRPYDQNLVLTLGRNIAEEYSLAFDFQELKLNVDQSYSVTLQPGPGQIRAYELMPASRRAMVVRLGFDDSFFKALGQSNELKMEIDGTAYQFSLPEFSQGKTDLDTCLAGIKNPSQSGETKVASGFSVEKVEDAAPIKIAETVKKEAPQKTPEQAVEIVKDEIETAPVDVAPVIAKAEPEIEVVAPAPKLQSNLPRISKAIEISRVETRQVDATPRALMPSKVAKADIAPGVSAKPLPPLMPKSKAVVSKPEVSKPEIKVETIAAEAPKLASPIISSPAPKLDVVKPEAKPVKVEIAKAETPKIVTPVVSAPVITAPVIAEPVVKEPVVKEPEVKIVTKTDPKLVAELDAVRAQLKVMDAENKELSNQANLARSQENEQAVRASNEALKKVREYEKKLVAAQNDNKVLSQQIEELRRSQEDSVLQTVSGDWDLEKSTKRFNEAEREIKRLGMLLEQQRVVHRQEKSELEQLLFDPAVTEREQRKRLNELETQLAEAQRQLEIERAQQSRAPRPEMVPQKAPVVERAPVRPAPEIIAQEVRKAERAKEQEIQRLNAQIARQNQELSAMSKRPVSSPELPAKVSKVVKSSTPTQSAYDQNDIATLLNRSGVKPSRGVSSPTSNEYTWNTGSLKGRALVMQDKNINQVVQNYITSAEKSCVGDFASLPSESNNAQAKAYELACIGGGQDMASSVVFTQKNGAIIAIAHETSTDNMDAAIDARSRIIANL